MEYVDGGRGNTESNPVTSNGLLQKERVFTVA